MFFLHPGLRGGGRVPSIMEGTEKKNKRLDVDGE